MQGEEDLQDTVEPKEGSQKGPLRVAAVYKNEGFHF